MTAATPPAIQFTPIGYVESDFTAYAPSDEMRAHTSRIILRPELAPGLLGLTPGQPILVLFHLHHAADYQLQLHPGHNPENTVRGVFATRSQYRPNPIAATIAQIQTIDHNTLTVTGLDAQNGSPVLDLKPHAPAFDQPTDAPPPENNPE